jgi:hypothetical protein
MIHTTKGMALASALLACLVVSTQAQVISWNLDNNSTVTGAGSYAGVYLANNWNNSWPSNPTTDLIDNSGAATTLDLSYTSANSWSMTGSHPGTDLDGSYNKEMLNGYMNSGVAGWTSINTSSFSLSQIPYTVYDLYVYFSSDAAGRTGTVTDGTTTFDFATLGSASVSGANATFTQTTDTVGANPGANYAVFSGLSGGSQTITVNIPDWGGIAGFQVVAAPEPSSMALGALTLAGLFFNRRFRRN